MFGAQPKASAKFGEGEGQRSKRFRQDVVVLVIRLAHQA